MKVLHVIPSISPQAGGPSKAVIEMVAALRQTGVDAAVLTTNDDGQQVLDDLPTARWVEYGGVPLLAFPRWNPGVAALREFKVSPGLMRWLDSHVSDYQLLHVHALFCSPATAAMALARRHRIPYVLRTIGQLSPWSLAQSSGRKRIMMRLIERSNLQGAAALHFTSAAERDEAACLGLTPPSLVLPLGVRTTVAQPRDSSDPADPIRFLFLSRLHPKKQLDRLMQALALLAMDQPAATWRLHIAGRGEATYENELRSLAERLGIAAHCRWLGQVQGADKERELAAADWLVLPSAAENFGIAVAEALAAGTPVVVSPQVAMAELVREAGAGMVCDSDPAELARTLATALAGPSPTMRQAALNLAQQRLAWSAIAADLKAAYAGILRSESHR